MPLVMNTSVKEQQICVHGAWFSFKPKQAKEMDDAKVMHLVSTCSYLGFVSLPDEFSDPDHRNTEAGKRTLKEAEESGVRNRISYLERLKQNELVALQRDLDKANLKYDARIEMSDEMIANLEELASYKSKRQDEAALKVDRVRAIEKLLEE